MNRAGAACEKPVAAFSHSAPGAVTRRPAPRRSASASCSIGCAGRAQGRQPCRQGQGEAGRQGRGARRLEPLADLGRRPDHREEAARRRHLLVERHRVVDRGRRRQVGRRAEAAWPRHPRGVGRAGQGAARRQAAAGQGRPGRACFRRGLLTLAVRFSRASFPKPVAFAADSGYMD